jgi:hypothetical protein
MNYYYYYYYYNYCYYHHHHYYYHFYYYYYYYHFYYCYYYYCYYYSYYRDSVVGIVMGYELDGWVFDYQQRQAFILFSAASRPALVSTELPVQRVSGSDSPEVKRSVREADHSLPSSA